MARIELNTPLSIDEIDFRVQSINNGKYATILAYKDARVDMNRLDAAVGIMNWQKKYDIVNGNLFCSVGIYDDSKKEWIWKQDVGTESQTEKEKGEASDSFKRACFNWGIGRELYNYPLIQVHLKDSEVQKDNSQKYKPTFDFKLKLWKWEVEISETGIVKKLSCKDEEEVERYFYSQENGIKKIYAKNAPASPQPTVTPPPTIPAKTRLVIGSKEFYISVGYLKDGYKKPDGTLVDVSIDDLKRQFTIGTEVEEALKVETLKS